MTPFIMEKSQDLARYFSKRAQFNKIWENFRKNNIFEPSGGQTFRRPRVNPYKTGKSPDLTQYFSIGSPLPRSPPGIATYVVRGDHGPPAPGFSSPDPKIPSAATAPLSGGKSPNCQSGKTPVAVRSVGTHLPTQGILQTSK